VGWQGRILWKEGRILRKEGRKEGRILREGGRKDFEEERKKNSKAQPPKLKMQPDFTKKSNSN
jgi:hypothetical protein